MTTEQIARQVAIVAGSMSLAIVRRRLGRAMVQDWINRLEQATAALKEKLDAA